MGWFSNNDKVFCDSCGKKTSQKYVDCWDADEDDVNNRKWSDKFNCMLYVRKSYYNCTKCSSRNTVITWHP